MSAAPTLDWLFRRFTAARHLPGPRSAPAWRSVADTPLDAGYLNGSCLLVRREMFEEIGGLDDGYFLYWDDMEYSRRALARGWKLLWTSSATVYHARAPGSSGVDDRVRHWQGLVGARRYVAQPGAATAFPFLWPIFKLMHLASFAYTCVESRAKAGLFALVGNPERSERHRRRWRDAAGFLSTYGRDSCGSEPPGSESIRMFLAIRSAIIESHRRRPFCPGTRWAAFHGALS